MEKMTEGKAENRPARTTPMSQVMPPTLAQRFKAMPLWQKALGAVGFVVVAAVAGYMLYSEFYIGCECPEGYLNTDPAGPSCACEGTSLTCKYNCGDGRCFVNGENLACQDIDEQWAQAGLTSVPPAPPGQTVGAECASAFDSSNRCTSPCSCSCECAGNNGDSGCDCKKNTAAAVCCTPI
jgi:hypothetical protein